MNLRGVPLAERIFTVLASYGFRQLRDGTWLVTSPEGSIYSVDPRAGTCTCPHHVHRQVPCKHLLAVRELLKLQSS